MTPTFAPLPASPAHDAHLGHGVSIVLPVLNEELYLADAVKSILSQDFSGPFEIILAVGPSRDGTLTIAQEIASRDSRISIIDNPTGRTATGLNRAIEASNFPIVIRVDAHAQIPANYISLSVALLSQTGAVNVGGVMAAEGITRFERSVARAMRSPLGVGASSFHTGGKAGEVDTVYLGCFLKSALVAIGGYDEKFTRAQDWELNFRLRQAGGSIYFDPRLEVTYRPRSTLRALAKQYFEYGRWRRVVSRRHAGTVNARYLAPPFSLLASTTSLVMGWLIHPAFFIPSGIYLSFLICASAILGKSVMEKMRLPLILLTMHMSWGVGFLTSPKKLVP